MVNRLVEFVVQTYQEMEAGRLEGPELPLTLQDVAVAATWYDACAGDPQLAQQWAAIPNAIAAWALHAKHLAPPTEGRRAQWVLRDLIQELQDGELDRLGWDEIAFLGNVCRLGERAVDPSRFKQPLGLLASFRESVEARRAGSSSTTGLPGLSARLHVVTSEDIERAPSRQVGLFAGIQMPCLGPVLTHPGHVMVLGNVPENCTVVVEKKSCSIRGFLLGRVAARHHCDVRENISGVVVVRDGNVRARNIVDRAFVVSKWSAVRCREAQNPRLVFAGSEIRVRGTALAGLYISPRIHVDGEARGGVYQVSMEVRARRFAPTPTQNGRVVLRRDLSWADYGETAEDEWARLVLRGRALYARLTRLRALTNQVDGEAESLAANIIIYLYSEDKVREHMERIQAAHRRLALLKRLIAGLDALARGAEGRFESPEERPATPPQTLDQGDSAAYADVHNELRLITAEESVEPDLTGALEELERIRERLGSAEGDRKQTSLLLMRVRSELERWAQEIPRLGADIERNEAALRRTMRDSLLVPKPGSRKSMLEVLNEAVATAAVRGPGDPLERKLQTGLVQHMLRKVRLRTDLGRKYRNEAETVQGELQKIHARLHKEHGFVMTGDLLQRDEGAKAVGRFDAGMEIYADAFLLGESAPPEGSVIVTRDSEDAVTCYVRTLTGIVEQRPFPSRTDSQQA